MTPMPTIAIIRNPVAFSLDHTVYSPPKGSTPPNRALRSRDTNEFPPVV
jgi:hypothetical protein